MEYNNTLEAWMFRATLSEVQVLGAPGLRPGVRRQVSLHAYPIPNNTQVFAKLHLTLPDESGGESAAEFRTVPFASEDLRRFNLRFYLSAEDILRQIAKICTMQTLILFRSGVQRRGRFYFKMGPVLAQGIIGYDPLFFRAETTSEPSLLASD